MYRFPQPRQPLPRRVAAGALAVALGITLILPVSPGCSGPEDQAARGGPVPIDSVMNGYVARVMVLNERHTVGEFGTDSLGVLTSALRTEMGVNEDSVREYIDSHRRSLEDWESFLRSVQSTIRTLPKPGQPDTTGP